MASRFDLHQIPDPRVRQFAMDCLAAGTTPEDVLSAAGFHRTAWFRWRRGTSMPTFKTWDRAQAALNSARRASSVSADRSAEGRAA